MTSREKREIRIGRVVEISKRCWLSADDGGRYELNRVDGGWQIVDYATGDVETMTDEEVRLRSAERYNQQLGERLRLLRELKVACSTWNPASV